MRKARFTTEQIMAILQEHSAGAAPAELVRRHRISRQTFCSWQKRYGDLHVSDARRLKTLEDEKRRLKRLVADQAHDLQILKDVLGFERSSVHYVPQRPLRDAPLRTTAGAGGGASAPGLPVPTAAACPSLLPTREEFCV